MSIGYKCDIASKPACEIKHYVKKILHISAQINLSTLHVQEQMCCSHHEEQDIERSSLMTEILK